MQKFDLETLQKESREIFAEDGMLYIFCGLLLLFFSAAFAVPALAPFVGFSAFLIYPVLILRRRLIYPRIGYARYPASAGALRGVLIFAVITAIAFSFLVFTGDGRFQQYLPLAFSLVIALAIYFGTSSHGIRRGDWFIIMVTTLTGLFTTWYYTDWQDGAAVLFGFLGGILLFFGLAKLALFLRKHPPLGQGDGE